MTPFLEFWIYFQGDPLWVLIIPKNPIEENTQWKKLMKFPKERTGLILHSIGKTKDLKLVKKGEKVTNTNTLHFTLE